jgi:hypothetical protein
VRRAILGFFQTEWHSCKVREAQFVYGPFLLESWGKTPDDFVWGFAIVHLLQGLFLSRHKGIDIRKHWAAHLDLTLSHAQRITVFEQGHYVVCHAFRRVYDVHYDVRLLFRHSNMCRKVWAALQLLLVPLYVEIIFKFSALFKWLLLNSRSDWGWPWIRGSPIEHAEWKGLEYTRRLQFICWWWGADGGVNMINIYLLTQGLRVTWGGKVHLIDLSARTVDGKEPLFEHISFSV